MPCCCSNFFFFELFINSFFACASRTNFFLSGVFICRDKRSLFSCAFLAKYFALAVFGLSTFFLMPDNRLEFLR